MVIHPKLCVEKVFSKLLLNINHQSCLKTAANVKTNLSTGGLKEDLYLVDISKRSLTELTLQPVAPVLSSSCSQPNELSNQFMVGSRRLLLRNCFISIDSKEALNIWIDYKIQLMCKTSRELQTQFVCKRASGLVQ